MRVSYEDLCLQPKLCACFVHLCAQHRNDVFRGVIAKKLPERLFMPRDAVLVDQCNKIPLCVTFQRGFAEMFVLADEIRGAGLHVGEIAAPATRNTDFFAGRFGVVDDQCAWTCMCGTHHASSTCAYDQSVYFHATRCDVETNQAQGCSRSCCGVAARNLYLQEISRALFLSGIICKSPLCLPQTRKTGG